LTGWGLAGCSYFAPIPVTFPIQLESTPPGANAITSLGPACTTPCTVNVPIPEDDFSVSFTLNDYLPATIPVRVRGNKASFGSPGTTSIDPSPVFAQLEPVPPPPPPKPVRKKKPKA
jgi:hypothetical protein